MDHSKPIESKDGDIHTAVTMHQQGDFKGAEVMYRYILENDPTNADALHLCGLTLYQTGNYDGAVDMIRQAISLDPKQAMFYHNLGNVYRDKGDLNRAATCSCKAIQLCPNYADAHYGLGQTLQLEGRLEPAIESYHRALSLNSALTGAYINLGRLYKSMDQIGNAIAAYQTALSIDPANAAAHNNLGTIYQQLGRLPDAVASYKKARFIDPNYVLASHNLGNVFQKMRQFENAIDCYQAALKIKTDFAPALYHLGLVYQHQRRHTRAIDCFRKALHYRENYPKARCYLYHQLQHICSWHELEELGAHIDRATLDRIRQDRRPDEPPFLSLSRRIDSELNFKIARAWSAEISRRANGLDQIFSHTNHNRSKQLSVSNKIIVGYLSNNFKNHPTAYLTSGLFRRHNRDHFQINCYSYGHDDQSEARKNIQADSDHFVDIANLSHADAAKRIHDDRVDILVDLVGFTEGHRLDIAALRPAAVQARWLGQAGTSGADFFDYIIVDPVIVPKEQARYYSEQLVYLPHCYQVNNQDQSVTENVRHREDLELPRDAFVLCCFCSSYKLDATMFDCWIRILQAVDSSVLWLLGGNPSVEKNLKNYARNRGVRSDQIVFAPPWRRDMHLARLRMADLALDTRIVNGAATTSDALWAGVPVLTLQGGHFASRMSSSILTALGLAGLITQNLAQYEATAVQLAQHPARLKDLRQKLAANLLTHPLFDTTRFTRNLERAFKKMWRLQRVGDTPHPLEVREDD